MTDPKPDVCRVMAEQMFDQLDAVPVGDETPELLETLIRTHTIVPEMVELIEQVATLGDVGITQHLRAKAKMILAKAERGNDD